MKRLRPLKPLLQRWLPPDAIRIAKHWTGRNVRLSGDYPSWDEALRHAGGYDADSILAQARQSANAVRNEEAAFDRDGATFARADPPLPLLAGLMRAAALDHGKLHVVDFGGALGSTYIQCRSFFEGLSSVRWQVVEQDHFVACGRELFADNVLGFSTSIAEAAATVTPNAVLLSGVLQYLSAPQAVLREIAELRARIIIVDRTPLTEGSREVITLQQVSRNIVQSSYPARLFTRASLLAPFGNRYKVKAEFDAVDGKMGGVLRLIEFKGFVLEATE